MHQSILDVMNFGVGVQSGDAARLWGILYSQVQKVIPTLPPPLAALLLSLPSLWPYIPQF